MVHTVSTGVPIQNELERLVETSFPMHPFENGVSQRNALVVLRSYFAMSQAFPYLQAGALKDLIFRSMEEGGLDERIEVTAAVAAFLVSDETGVNFVLGKGIESLPEILATRRNFHANLLREDLRRIFRDDIQPSYDSTTREYLGRLFSGLASGDHLERCAEMVAFEAHAGRMIDALWCSVASLFPHVSKESLEYFRTHVGENGAEPFHQVMTGRMIDKIVQPADLPRFFAAFANAYQRNIAWCAAICN